MILGFQRAVFSNEAGIGSAPIAHSAVKTNEPVTEGYVALLEPFIDTVVICSITALVILTTIYEPGMAGTGVQGVELTSKAFASTISWSVIPLSIVAVLFAFSTIISWSYYGLKGWTYLFGESAIMKSIFKRHILYFCDFGLYYSIRCRVGFLRCYGLFGGTTQCFRALHFSTCHQTELKSYQKRLADGRFGLFVDDFK